MVDAWDNGLVEGPNADRDERWDKDGCLFAGILSWRQYEDNFGRVVTRTSQHGGPGPDGTRERVAFTAGPEGLRTTEESWTF